MTLRQKVFSLVEPSPNMKHATFWFDAFILILILLNILAVILQSDAKINAKFYLFFSRFELFSVVVFTIEYVFRLWSCVEKTKYINPITGRLRWMTSPMALIDLLAILPFYLPFAGIDLRFIRIFRLFRIFRLLKISRYINAAEMIRNVIVNKKEELLISLFAISVLLLVVSSFMYFVEGDIQPQAFGSIPKSLWWGVITMTTVGYGDVYPVTTVGKILGSIVAILGVGIVALPTGLLASGFSDEIKKRKNK